MSKIFNVSIFFMCCCNPVFAQPYFIYQTFSTTSGLPSNFILSVCEDENGFLWAGTDKGLARYNGFNWQVWDKDNGLPGNYINQLFSDKRGKMYVEIGGKGFYTFDINEATIKKPPAGILINKYGFFEEKISANKSFELYFTPNGKNTKVQKIADYEKDASINWFYDVGSKKIISVITDAADSASQKKNYKSGWKLEFRLLPEPKNDKGIYLVNDSIIITNSHFYKYSKGKLFSTFTMFQNNTYAFSCVTKKGFYITDVKTGYYFINNNGDKKFYSIKNGLGADNVNQIYELTDGTIALATLGAGLHFIKNDYKKSYLTGNKSVRTIQKWGSNWYVLAADNVYKIDGSTFALNTIGVVATPAFSLLKTQDAILISSFKGIVFYKENPNLHPYHLFAWNAGVSSIIKTNNSYLASSYGNGIIAFNDKNAEYTRALGEMDIVEKMLPLLNGYVSLSYEDGLIITDTVKNKSIHLSKKNGLLSNSIQHVYQKQDTFWISSKKGINIYSNGILAKTYSYNQGFLGNMAIYCFHDINKQLWVVSDKYLHKLINGKLHAVTSNPIITDNDDLITTACYDPQTNTLATGSAKNISLISLDRIMIDSAVKPPKLFYTKFDNKVQTASSFSVPYRFDNIIFTFSSFAASPLSPAKLFYKLVGREQEWTQLNNSLSISYADLRPGSYRLIAKVINADGYDSDEKLLATFIVNKPFWERLWFFILLFFATVLFTILIVKRIEYVKRKNKDAKLFLQQTLQNERERISKDLHDHLGSNLVTMLAQVDNIETKLQKNAFSEVISTVQLLSFQVREVMNVLRETVWAVQENEHSLDEFLIRIKTFLQRLYETTNITWQIKVEQNDAVCLSPKQTLQLFRILQEVSQNIIKHSKASEVVYEFINDKINLKISVIDNGCGLEDQLHNSTGNGLSSIKNRVKELDGQISIQNNNGTSIFIEIPLTLKSC